MYKLTLKCRVITPMFMAGANGKIPELRPSEFKGMMRWWWRAVKAEDKIETLKKIESEIFGGAGEGEGKSKVRLVVKGNLQGYTGHNLKSEYKLKWDFDSQNRTLTGQHAGIGYLLYSTVLSRRERAFIKDDFQFELTLMSHERKYFDIASASMWLAIYLGGFGTRARRGGGNIEVFEINGNESGIEFIIDSEKIQDWLKKNFQKAHEIINNSLYANKFCYTYSNLSFSRFIVSKSAKNNWIEALEEIGEVYKSFREKHRKDVFDTGSFGLPVVHRSSRLEAKDYDRRASPIIVRILHCREGYRWMVIRLAGEFLPQGEVLKYQGKTQKPDYGLLDEFWSSLKKEGSEEILNKPDILSKIEEKIISELQPRRIIFFGSRARGDAHKNSDIDIAVDVNGSIGKLTIEAPVDIVNMRFADEKLKEKINREGILLYERKS